MKLRNPVARNQEAPEAPKPLDSLTPKDVWESPTDYNRATRRWARLWGSIWSWDAQALGSNSGAGGRYLRRHYNEERFAHPKTRRQRRHRNRILRIMKGA